MSSKLMAAVYRGGIDMVGAKCCRVLGGNVVVETGRRVCLGALGNKVLGIVVASVDLESISLSVVSKFWPVEGPIVVSTMALVPLSGGVV